MPDLAILNSFKSATMTLQSIDQVLTHTLSSRTTWHTHQQFQQLLDCWADVVGTAVANHARPIGINRRVLQVATANPAWSQSLTFERHRILAKLCDRIGLDLTDIRFSPGQWLTANRRDQQRTVETELLRQHPSFVAMGPDPDPEVQPQQGTNSHDPEGAYQQWAAFIQTRSQQCPLCPQCHCPTPLGELQRWSTCGICASHGWGS